MRYLALRHAQALLLRVETSEELREIYLPLYLRECLKSHVLANRRIINRIMAT
jgi:hypothetical protein